MRRVAAVIGLRPERAAEYLELHRSVWPGVQATLRAAHVTNYSIFLRDGLLFSYFEYVGEDYEADMARIATAPVTKSWWQLTDPCQQPLQSAAPGERWAVAEEVFRLTEE
jgi:L-rhamnose mutarotase